MPNLSALLGASGVLKSSDKTGLDAGIVSGTAGTTGDLAVWDSNGDLIDGPTPPSGAIVGTTDTQTLSNKTLAGATLSGAVAGNDNEVSRVNLKDYGEITNALGTVGASPAIDLTLGNVVTATVSGTAPTFSFTNPTAGDEGCSFTLVLTNGGSQTVTWPASVDWPGGTAPSLVASGVDILEFFTVNGGTTWFGFGSGLDMK